MIRAAGEQTIEEVVVETVGSVERLGDDLRRILIEIETGRTEGKIEIGDDDVAIETAGNRPGNIVGDHRRADATLGADEGNRMAERTGGAIDVEVGNRLDDLHQADGRHQILADAALSKSAVELDVVDVADDDYLGAGVADFRQTIELGLEVIALQFALDDDQVRRRRGLVELGGGGDAARLNLDMSPRHAAVAGGRLDGGNEVRRFAECLDGDAGNRPHVGTYRRRTVGMCRFFHRPVSSFNHGPTPVATVPPFSL